jgi:hypothetical protein
MREETGNISELPFPKSNELVCSHAVRCEIYFWNTTRFPQKSLMGELTLSWIFKYIIKVYLNYFYHPRMQFSLIIIQNG